VLTAQAVIDDPAFDDNNAGYLSYSKIMRTFQSQNHRRIFLKTTFFYNVSIICRLCFPFSIYPFINLVALGFFGLFAFFQMYCLYFSNFFSENYNLFLQLTLFFNFFSYISMHVCFFIAFFLKLKIYPFVFWVFESLNLATHFLFMIHALEMLKISKKYKRILKNSPQILYMPPPPLIPDIYEEML
jgi:hypothetical protein